MSDPAAEALLNKRCHAHSSVGSRIQQEQCNDRNNDKNDNDNNNNNNNKNTVLAKRHQMYATRINSPSDRLVFSISAWTVPGLNLLTKLGPPRLKGCCESP